MRAGEKIGQRLNQLVDTGDEILNTKYKSEYRDWVQNDLFLEWRASALSVLKSVFGEDSTHFGEFVERCKMCFHSDAVEGQAILKAAKTDFEGGFLQRLENLVSADVFSDFLEMAAHLVEQGYKDPAASLIGAVLEDGLRSMCRTHGITLKAKEDVSSLNQKLADRQVYNRLTQKQIEVWNEVRNNADHGHFDRYGQSDVDQMLQNVRQFLSASL